MRRGHKNNFNKLFPLANDLNSLPKYLSYCENILGYKVKETKQARINGDYGKKKYLELIKKWDNLPYIRENPEKLIKNLVTDFFSGIPRWRSPELVHNVGSPTNIVASSIYSLAIDENIYNINEGLTGNTLIAEQIVVNLLSNLAGIKKQTTGFFTFGGTATNFYATKVGIKKADNLSGSKGITKNLKAFITEDSHFSHLVCADWLGLGTDNVLIINANKNRTSKIQDAEMKMREVLDSGGLISSIIINGGTTYDHTVDNIKEFIKLRDKLVKEYKLGYKPHLHVDSVIGWSWLFFNNYDWKKNVLKIDSKTLNIIKKQARRISQLRYADSWGIDFHKGIGGCPIPCSLIIFNNLEDINYLSKKKGNVIRMAQLAEEFYSLSPVNFTLETSRPGGAPLAALASLYSLGIEGFQKRLANLINNNLLLKERLKKRKDFFICNYDSLGFVTMLRLYPPELNNDPRKFLEIEEDNDKMRNFVKYVNNYLKKFFEWDFNTRILKNKGIEYSYSDSYIKLKSGLDLSAIKIYPVSPYFSEKIVDGIISTLINQKKKFDERVWKNEFKNFK
ncbi:MAG: pyridoxal-dependent decarboxylase [Candidatus Nanoarchaeia archaeon]